MGTNLSALRRRRNDIGNRRNQIGATGKNSAVQESYRASPERILRRRKIVGSTKDISATQKGFWEWQERIERRDRTFVRPEGFKCGLPPKPSYNFLVSRTVIAAVVCLGIGAAVGSQVLIGQRPKTPWEQAWRIQTGMSSEESVRLLGKPSKDGWSPTISGKAVYSKAPSFRTLKWESDQHILTVMLDHDKVIDWRLDHNRDPLIQRYKRIRLGMTPEEVQSAIGAADGNTPYWSPVKRAALWMYWEGSDPAQRALELCFINEKLVSRRFGASGVRFRGRPWDEGWTPLNDP